MTQQEKTFTPGIKKKIVAIVVAGVCLSIGITTFINYIFISDTLTKTTGEKISLISEKTKSLVLEEIDNELKFLTMISLSSTVRDVVIKANKETELLSAQVLKEKATNLDKDWSSFSTGAKSLKTEIESSAASQFLRDLQKIDTKDVEIIVTDRLGFNVAMTARTTDYWQGDEEWWQTASKGSIFVSTPLYDESSQHWALNMATPIFDSSNQKEVIGVVKGTADVTTFLNAIFDIRFGETGKGFFISNDRKVYSRQIKVLQILPISGEFRQSLLNKDGQWINDFSDLNGKPGIAAPNEIKIGNQTIGWILVLLEKGELQDIVLSTMQKNIAIALILILVLGTVGSLMANNILEVIRVLREEVYQIAIGDYSLSFSEPIASSNDPDVHGLVDSFNRMKTAVQTREKTILSSEKKYRNLVETMNEGLVVVDELGRIAYANPKLDEMTGYQKGEMTGKSLLTFFPREEKEDVAFQWTSRIVGFQNSYETTILRKTGERIPVLISPQRLVDEKDNFLGSIAVLTDVSISKRIELTQQKKIEELASLRKVDIAILTKTTLKSVIQIILDQIKNQLGADAAVIHVFHQNSTKSKLSRAFIEKKSFQCVKDDIYFDRIRKYVLQKSYGLKTTDIIDQVTWKPLQALDFKTLYVAPIMIADDLKGIIEIAFFHTKTIDDDWLSFFHAMTTQTAVGIVKSELFGKLQTRNKELQEAYISAIKGWAKALELRDEETKGHSDRVVQMAITLAVTAGYQGKDLENFRNGAFLHDIGKMGIPDGILLKPGPLSDEEWVIMRKHPVFAYQLLREIPFLKDAFEIPYYHHERWNGSGYPHGLKGEEIPLAARIFAVVDVWDALTSDRPYRNAWSSDQAMKYLQENKGILFDANVVDTFFNLFPISKQ